jgi:hypothetical protein
MIAPHQGRLFRTNSRGDGAVPLVRARRASVRRCQGSPGPPERPLLGLQWSLAGVCCAASQWLENSREIWPRCGLRTGVQIDQKIALEPACKEGNVRRTIVVEICDDQRIEPTPVRLGQGNRVAAAAIRILPEYTHET